MSCNSGPNSAVKIDRRPCIRFRCSFGFDIQPLEICFHFGFFTSWISLRGTHAPSRQKEEWILSECVACVFQFPSLQFSGRHFIYTFYGVSILGSALVSRVPARFEEKGNKSCYNLNQFRVSPQNLT